MHTKLTGRKSIMSQIGDEYKPDQTMQPAPQLKTYCEWLGYYWKQWFRK